MMITFLEHFIFVFNTMFSLIIRHFFHLDGGAYYDEWQHLVEKSDKQVKELLEAFGTKCKSLGVKCITFVNFSLEA